MPDLTLVEFTATPKMKTWRHSDGGSVSRRHGERRTTMVEAPLILKDGDRVKMSKVDLAWCRATYPQNFFEVDAVDDEESEA